MLDERQVEASGLRAPDRRPVLREDFAPTLEAAIGHLAEADRPGARAIIERLTCGLPPFLVEPGLVDVARGVLRGRVDDLQRFDEVLARAEVWNAAKGVAVPRRDARWVAERMKALRKRAPHQDDGPPADPRGTIVEFEARLLLLAAAGAAAPDDTAFVRNVELVYGQLAQGEHLAGILASAWDALDGRPDSFRRALGSLGGCLPPDDKPFPYPPDPGPLGWPDGGTLHWPGERLPTPPPRFAECDMEALRALVDAQLRAVRYTIDSVEPPRACPGDTVTIRGTNLRFEGQTVGVWFSSGQGTPIHAAPLSAPTPTNTEIGVVVPTGAQCGPLELEIPVGTTVFACGVRIELYSGPTTPFYFHGGETVIKRFSHTAGACPRSGEPVSFSWEICNATQIELRLVHHYAGGLDTTVTLPLAPTDSHHTHVLPPSTLDYGLEVILTATDPCGQDAATVRFGVQRTIGAGPSPYISGTFTNWHQNISRVVLETRPDSLQKLVDAVVAAERESPAHEGRRKRERLLVLRLRRPAGDRAHDRHERPQQARPRSPSRRPARWDRVGVSRVTADHAHGGGRCAAQLGEPPHPRRGGHQDLRAQQVAGSLAGSACDADAGRQQRTVDRGRDQHRDAWREPRHAADC